MSLDMCHPCLCAKQDGRPFFLCAIVGLASAAPRFAADAVIVCSKIIRRENGTGNNHRVGGEPANPTDHTSDTFAPPCSLAYFDNDAKNSLSSRVLRHSPSTRL